MKTLTTQEIEAGNLKIHIFMGNKRMTKVVENHLETYIPGYYYVWELLINVVERIEELDKFGGIVTILQGRCRIEARNLGDKTIYADVDNYMLLGVKGKMKSVFEAILIYIDWYNKQIM